MIAGVDTRVYDATEGDRFSLEIEILLIFQLLRTLEILAIARLQAVNSCPGVVGVLLKIQGDF
jgi:hypothetical protein